MNKILFMLYDLYFRIQVYTISTEKDCKMWLDDYKILKAKGMTCEKTERAVIKRLNKLTKKL